MVVSLKTDLRFPIPGQQGHEGRIIQYRFLHCHSEIIGISNEATVKDFRKAAVNFMKGYFVTDGYMGLVDGVYRLFADESDYYEYMND